MYQPDRWQEFAFPMRSVASHESCADAVGPMETGAMSVIETTAYVSLLALRLLGNDIRTTSGNHVGETPPLCSKFVISTTAKPSRVH